TMPSGPEPAAAPPSGDRLIVAMSDPDVNQFIVSGVFGERDGVEWRFTAPHALFRLPRPPPENVGFYMRFFVQSRALLERGNTSLTGSLNGHRFGSRFAVPGDMEYRAPVPREWIAESDPIEIAVDVDPGWGIANEKTYGLQLHSLGFERRRK